MAPSSSKPLLLVLFLLVALHATASDGAGICGGGAASKGQNCNIQCLVADPVCGADGVTYGCGCPEANCHGVAVVSKGPCPTRR